MNFDFSEDQKMIQAQARELLAERSTFPKLRQAANAERGFDADLWREVAELGWLSLDVPEEYGGMGCEGLERCVLSEELGRSLAPIPFASTSAVIDAVRLFGSDAQKARSIAALSMPRRRSTATSQELQPRYHQCTSIPPPRLSSPARPRGSGGRQPKCWPPKASRSPSSM